MDDEDTLHDAFSSKHLWKSSSFFEDSGKYESCLFGSLELDLPSVKLENPYAPKQSLDRELQLPDLDTFQFGRLSEFESFDAISLSTETPPPEPEDDIWEVALRSGSAKKDIDFFTWEAFEDFEHVVHRTCYVTEAEPRIFDAALAEDDEDRPSGRVIRSGVLIDSLFNLGLGRSSKLFDFDSKSKSFVPSIQDGRASGLSLMAAQSLVNQFITVGNACSYLRLFVERTFAAATSIPAKVALATCVSSILSALEEHLGEHRPDLHSLLQLQQVFDKPRRIMSHVAHIVGAVQFTKTNDQVSSVLHSCVQDVEEGHVDLRRLSCQILVRVAKPSLDTLSEWIGLLIEQRTVPVDERATFVIAQEDSDAQGPSEYAYDPAGMPCFVYPEDGETVFETGNSLRFLRSHHPKHPLASPESFGIQAPSLAWAIEWKEIEHISAKARAYEENLRQAITSFSQGAIATPAQHKRSTIASNSSLDVEGLIAPEYLSGYLEESVRAFDQDPGIHLRTLPNELQLLIEEILSEHPYRTSQVLTFSPPLAITSMLSFRPLLTAQARLVNASTMRLFFRSHQIRMHLSLQRQYHLLGDGVFSSYLASALFDPDRETAERQKGTMRSGVHMGLQVGSRSTWPPASSELRLALMGVLSQSFYTSALYHSTLTKKSTDASGEYRQRDTGDELPGQLNFAVRQLSDSEMEKVLDPDSLYALDFLRLQYIPPSPLNLVITSASLEKYDDIFKFLLRLLRMLFVVSHLPWEYVDIESRHFRAEAHHFVTTLSTYIFQTGIAESWNIFASYLSGIETRLASEDVAGELGTLVVEGLGALKTAHDKCLDSIMFALLLRSRQKKIMMLLEDIFEDILLFAKMQKPESAVEVQVSDLYAKLNGNIKVFISVCKGLTGKRGYGKGKGTSEENTIERLLLLLDMNGYYGAESKST